MKFDPQKHHRRSIRLPNYDYTQPGGYFVTIVTYHRDLLFGVVRNEEMRLNNYGKIADECWRAIPDHFQNVELDAYVIMPNHVHGIIRPLAKVFLDTENTEKMSFSQRSQWALWLGNDSLMQEVNCNYQR